MENIIRNIGEKLVNSNTILIFSHTMPDGDALGSSVALCRALRNYGKQAYIIVEEELALNLKFLDNEKYCIYADGTESPDALAMRLFGTNRQDVSVIVDAGDYTRIEKRATYFDNARFTICIDHHDTNKKIAELNLVDPSRAATGEMIYYVIREIESITGQILLDEKCREGIYTAIITDTGNFQHSNTTSDSHKIVMELMNEGLQHNKISICIYQSNRLERILIKNKIISEMKVFAEGKAAISFVSQEMLKDVNALLDETEGIIDELRNIRGVEIAVLLKELPDGRIKASLRAKDKANVAEIAKNFGGGGHIKAAGCTFVDKSMNDVIAIISEEITKVILEETL